MLPCQTDQVFDHALMRRNISMITFIITDIIVVVVVVIVVVVVVVVVGVIVEVVVVVVVVFDALTTLALEKKYHRDKNINCSSFFFRFQV